MNIHINTKSALDNFDQNSSDVLFSCVFGSFMYGINHENSDIDLMMITKSIKSDKPLSHHQIQLKNNFKGKQQTDVIITTIDQFVQNLLSGDSTINFEIIAAGKDIENSKLSFFKKHLDMFINYNLIKSYLGMAKRDIKYFSKATEENKKKKLLHIIRGVTTAQSLMNYVLRRDNNYNISIVFSVVNSFKTALYNSKSIEFNGLVKSFSDYEKELRIALNKMLDNKEIINTYTEEQYNAFMEDFKSVSDLEFDNKQTENFIRETLENYYGKDVEYKK